MLRRIFGWATALAAGGLVAFVTAALLGSYHAPAPVVAAELEEALAFPLDEPGMQLPEVARGEVPFDEERRARADVDVPAGECVFALAGAAASLPFERATLSDADTQEPLVWEEQRRSVALGWCAGEAPRSVTLGGIAQFARLKGESESMVYRFHVGPPAAPWERYIVGTPSTAALQELSRERGLAEGEARDAASAPSGRPLARADLEPGVALAVPLSDETRAVARALGTIGAPDEGYEPSLQGPAGATEGVHRPLAVLDGVYRRLLLVVDPGALVEERAVPCASLHFSRLAATPGEVTRVSLPDLAETEAEAHRVCPGDGLTAFVVPGDDPATWRVRVMREAYGRTRRRRVTPLWRGALVPRAHRLALSGCEAGEAAQCAAVAEDLAAGRYVPQDARAAARFAERACRSEPRHCGVHGDLLADAGEEDRAVPAWERACEAEDGSACARLAEARRLAEGTAFDAQGAYDAYRRACDLGVRTACTRAQTMTLLELAP